MRVGVVRVALLALLLPASGLEGQQGYSTAGDQIRIDQRSHWEAWAGAAGVLNISPDGAVRPNFKRKNINAALNATNFSLAGEGGVVALSNQAEAGNLIDGDMSTTWGPDPDSPLGDWAVTINLGRIVVVQKIVVRFAEQSVGDPFLQFKVLVWRQGPSSTWRQAYTLPATDIPNYWEIGRTIKPNKTERVMEFVPRTSTELWNFSPITDSHRGHDAIFVGDPIQSLQIIAIDSDFDRAQEISAAAHDALTEEKKGAVDHYRRGRTGLEVLVSEEEYESFSNPDRRGSIKYYRKEIPRLAEVEIWTPGDNISLGAFERGGKVIVESDLGPQNQGSTITDGNYSTGYNGSADGGKRYEYFQDLGALFWIDTQQFIVDGSYPMDILRIDISDGALAPDGSIRWTRVGKSTGVKAFREFRHPPAKVRFVRGLFENLPFRAQWNVRHTQYVGFTEAMFYGRGFVAEVEMTSELIELGGNKNLVSIEWDADTPPGTRVEVQTRTGDTLEEEKVYYDSKGTVVTESRFNRLPASKKGEITSVFEPSPDWVAWSTDYDFSGESIKSPSPREFLLVRVRLESDDPDLAATLRSITVNISDPLADQLVGEVAPNRFQAIGQAEDLSYFIRPTFSSTGQGFDDIRIAASTGTSMGLNHVRTGSADDFAAGQPKFSGPGQIQVLAEGADTLWIRLPETLGPGVELVEVGFRPLVFSNSVTFDAAVQNSDNPGFWQRVDEGDATDLVSSQVTTVLALEGNDVVQDLRLDSAVLTPNGDGVNDGLIFHFSVARINGDKDVRLLIYDLSGVLVHRIVERRPDPRGNYTLEWSGRGRSGQRVPPGIYLARVEVDVDSDNASGTSELRTVYVVY
jgi:hypothetical protein